MTAEDIALVVFAYFMGSVIALLCAAEGLIEPEEVAWWPVAFAKYLLRSLWKVLTKGWGI